MGTALYISLLGRPCVDSSSRPIRIPSLKARALLWYLAAQRGQEFSRSHLATLLWADSPEPVGRQCLSTILNRLRHALPCWPIYADSDRVRWNGSAGVEVDTIRFLELCASPDDTESLARAAALWRGPFLEGYTVQDSDTYDSWIEQERQIWQNRILEVLTRLVQAEQNLGRWSQAIAYARRALLIDPLQERFHQALMTCYYLAGDRGAALSQYGNCERILREQLGVEPDESTRRLRDAIRSGSLPRPWWRQEARPIKGTARKAVRLGPFAFRQHEFRRLQEELKASAAGGKPALLLTGGVGMGKSHLVRELLDQLEPNTFGTVLRVRCQSAWQSQPLFPLVEALRVRIPPEQPETSIPALTQAVADRLDELLRPVLLVIEDFHWADASTVALLDSMLRHCRNGSSVALLLTSTPYGLHPSLHVLLREWEQDDLLTWHDLQPLSGAEFAALVHSRFPKATPAFIRLLHDETGGNPLFAITILEALEGEPPDRLPTTSQQLPMPPYLRSLVHERLSHLSDTAMRLLLVISVRDEGATLPELAHLTGLETNAVLDGLDELVASQLIAEDPDSDRVLIPIGFVRRTVCAAVSQSRLRHLQASLASADAVYKSHSHP